MPDNDPQHDLVFEVMKLLQNFHAGGKAGPLEDRGEWEQRVQSHPPQDRELLQELTRFADLWRYFQDSKEKLGPDIVAALKEVPTLTVVQRIERMREINHKLMERVPDAGEGLKFRN